MREPETRFSLDCALLVVEGNPMAAALAIPVLATRSNCLRLLSMRAIVSQSAALGGGPRQAAALPVIGRGGPCTGFAETLASGTLASGTLASGTLASGTLVLGGGL
ncbi:MAG: hypothetical protein MUF01_03925 [Bryobacterales bacterium]|nr:hypothetical protein [Bryobacterales bacterium]